MGFTKLEIKQEILTALEKLGYTVPTKIQELVINSSNNGKNIIGQSQTGTGKTAAFVIPLLNKVDPDLKKVQALIIAPTRELSIQIREEVFNLSKNLNVRSLAIYGGSSIFEQKKVLLKGPQIVVGTPGRIIDLIERNILKLNSINYLVLDEVDRMLDMGFIEDIDYIWNNLKNLKQVMTFSATITDQLKGIISKYIGNDYEFIKTSQEIIVDKIDHSFIDVIFNKKYDTLINYINNNPEQKTVIFTQTKIGTSELENKLFDDGYKVGSLHGDMSQRDRFKILKNYKENKINILVATDVASRGLNMNDIKIVINYDVPNDPESYIHRIGRTARAGQSGKAIMFVSRNEMKQLLSIERINKIKIKKVNEKGEIIERADLRRSNSYKGNMSKYSGGNRREKSGLFGKQKGSYGFKENNKFKKSFKPKFG